jgi:hypothetical protein
MFVIWSVGGKDSFPSALDSISIINREHPEERLENIIIVLDRDDEEIEAVISHIEAMFSTLGWVVRFDSNQKGEIVYTVEDKEYNLSVYLLIIPFSESGALESVLIQSLSNSSPELKYVAD